MGRIKTLEAELRKAEKSWIDSTATAQARYDSMLSVIEHAAGTREKLLPMGRQDFLWTLHRIRETDGTTSEEEGTPEQSRRALVAACLSDYRTSDANRAQAKEAEAGTRPAAEIAQEWISKNPRPEDWNPEIGTTYTQHLKLRLAYENQMLEAQGGRAAHVEMIPGGWLRGGRHLSGEERQIYKVNRSPATGRVVSVEVRDNHPSTVNHWGNPFPDGVTRILVHKVEVERLPPDAYRAPTAEELEVFNGANKAAKDSAEKVVFINPTKEDAERLQAILNEKAEEADKGQKYPRKAGTIKEITQAGYSDSCNDYRTTRTQHGVKIRFYACGWRYVESVIVLTDKPQKPIPAAFWEAMSPPKPAPVAVPVTIPSNEKAVQCELF
jgi:hypothetical protein